MRRICLARAGCLALIPLLNLLGAPGVVLTAAALAAAAALCLRAGRMRGRALRPPRCAARRFRLVAQLAGHAPFDIVDTKGHEGDRVLFSKWNSFSRVAVYDRPHGDWSLSPKFTGARRNVAVHGHRLRSVDAHPQGSPAAWPKRGTCAMS